MTRMECATSKTDGGKARHHLRQPMRHLFAPPIKKALIKQTSAEICTAECATCATSAPTSRRETQVVVPKGIISTMSNYVIGNTQGGAAPLSKMLWDVGQRWRRWRNCPSLARHDAPNPITTSEN